MEVSVNRKDLLGLLGKLQPVVPAKTNLPIVRNFLVKTGKHNISVSVNNLEVCVTGTVRAKIVKEGKCLLPLGILPFLKASSADKLILADTHNMKRVQKPGPSKEVATLRDEIRELSGWSSIDYNGVLKDEYKDTPLGKKYLDAVANEKPEFETRHSYNLKVSAGASNTTLPAGDVREFPPMVEVKGKGITFPNLVYTLKEVDYAMAKESNRPVLNGICFNTVKRSLELAAADGFRMAITMRRSI